MRILFSQMCRNTAILLLIDTIGIRIGFEEKSGRLIATPYFSKADVETIIHQYQKSQLYYGQKFEEPLPDAKIGFSSIQARDAYTFKFCIKGINDTFTQYTFTKHVIDRLLSLIEGNLI